MAALDLSYSTWELRGHVWGLSCSIQDMAPWPGIEPKPPALGAHHWTTREVPAFFFVRFFWSSMEACKTFTFP